MAYLAYRLDTDDDVRSFAQEHGFRLEDRGPGEVFVFLPGGFGQPGPNAMAGETVIDAGEGAYRWSVYSTEGLGMFLRGEI